MFRNYCHMKFLYFLVLYVHVSPVFFQFELSVRLDYLWKLRAQNELKNMEELQENNKQLIRNILPDHVAKHFMVVERNHEVSHVMLFNVYQQMPIAHSHQCRRTKGGWRHLVVANGCCLYSSWPYDQMGWGFHWEFLRSWLDRFTNVPASWPSEFKFPTWTRAIAACRKCVCWWRSLCLKSSHTQHQCDIIVTWHVIIVYVYLH